MFAQKEIAIMPKFRTRLLELMEENSDVSRMDIVRKANVSYATVVSWEKNSLQSIDAKVLILMDIFGKTSLDEILYAVDEDEG